MIGDIEGCTVTRGELEALVKTVGAYGVTVSEDWNEPVGARFIGTFKGTHITLFPRYDSHFAMYFTVAHLYGHMTQLAAPTPDMKRTLALVYDMRRPLTPDEVQGVYDYEVEAACVGRRVMAELGPVSPALDRAYSRMFFADFHYLIHYIETGECGEAAFERFLRREPVPWRLIEPDARAPVDLSVHPPVEVPVTVV